MKKNSADNYEPIMVCLTPDKTPIAYNNKVKCLMSSGMPREEAEKAALGPIELELYYEVGSGLMAIESAAVDSLGYIFSPYSGEEFEDSATCPECGSDDIYPFNTDDECNILKYQCENCGEIFDAEDTIRR